MYSLLAKLQHSLGLVVRRGISTNLRHLVGRSSHDPRLQQAIFQPLGCLKGFIFKRELWQSVNKSMKLRGDRWNMKWQMKGEKWQVKLTKIVHDSPPGAENLDNLSSGNQLQQEAAVPKIAAGIFSLLNAHILRDSQDKIYVEAQITLERSSRPSSSPGRYYSLWVAWKRRPCLPSLYPCFLERERWVIQC